MVNKLFTITNIIISITIIIITYFFISEYDLTKMDSIIPFYKFFTRNKSAILIKSIEVKNSDEECPINSSPLLFYKYPGTKEGCLISKKDLEEGSCNLWTKIFYKYENIQENKDKYFDILYTKKFCAFPFNNNNYLTNLNNNNDDEKICGILDTTGNNLYVKNNEECPINKIIINNEKAMDDFNTMELIENKYYLHYSNNYNGDNNYLLTNESFEISEGLPCINPGEINTYHIQYSLSKANESYICNTFIDNERLDKRYNLISSINKKDLYKDNNIDLETYFNYPFQEVNLNLYQLGYIGMDKNFITKILDDSDKYISDINKILDYNEINRYITLAIFSFIFLVIVNLIFKYFIVDCTIYILTFILLALNISFLVFGIFILTLINNFDNLEQSYINESNDKIFNSQLKYINDIINDSKNKNFKNIVGTGIIIFLILIFDILNCCIFNNPNNRLIKNKINIDNYFQNKKIFNSINVLKPFEDKKDKEKYIKFKKEIELSKINTINDDNDEEENNINNSKSEEEDILTNK